MESKYSTHSFPSHRHTDRYTDVHNHPQTHWTNLTNYSPLHPLSPKLHSLKHILVTALYQA